MWLSQSNLTEASRKALHGLPVELEAGLASAAQEALNPFRTEADSKKHLLNPDLGFLKNVKYLFNLFKQHTYDVYRATET